MKIRLSDLRKIIKEELNRTILSESMKIENPTLADFANYEVLKGNASRADKALHDKLVDLGPKTRHSDKNAAAVKLGLDPSSVVVPTDNVAKATQHFNIQFDDIQEFLDQNSHLEQSSQKDAGSNVYPDERRRTPGLTRFGGV